MQRARVFFSSTILVCLLFTNSASAKKVDASMVSEVIVPTAAAVYALSTRDLDGFKQLALAGLTTAHLTTFLKYSVERRRPDGSNTRSFPSGHTSISFAASGFVYYRYGWQWSVPFYAVSTGIGYSRVNVRAHWFSDVVAGAALGQIMAKVFTTKYNVRISPVVDRKAKNYGLEASIHY